MAPAGGCAASRNAYRALVEIQFENGSTVATDGPFAEIKEPLAGFWIIDASQERAIEVASRVAAYTGYPMEVRQLMHESIPA